MSSILRLVSLAASTSIFIYTHPYEREESMMMFENFLVVVEPAHAEHLALNRVVNFTGRQRHTGMSVHVFAGFESDDLTDPEQPVEVIRGRDWFNRLLAPLEESGVKLSAKLFWTRDWEKSVLGAAERTNADVIAISQSSALNRTSMADSMWSLLRNSKVPVLTIVPGAPNKREYVLAAVNMQTTDDEYTELNRKILLYAQQIADFYDAELHVVNAYSDSEDYPDRDRIRKIIDIDRHKIMTDMGKPEEVIAAAVEQVHADLVVMGTMSRRGLRATLRRNTSEKIIENLTVDVLTLN